MDSASRLAAAAASLGQDRRPSGSCAGVGGLALDIMGFPKKLNLRDSNPGSVRFSVGGVCNNVLRNLARLTVPVRLVSCVGDDMFGATILEEEERCGVDTSLCLRSSTAPSPIYFALMDEQSNMYAAVSDMDAVLSVTPAFLEAHRAELLAANALVIDGNLSPAAIDWLLALGHPLLCCDPVSMAKAARFRSFAGIHTLKPNIYEAAAMTGTDPGDPDCCARAAERFLAAGVQRVCISLGEKGAYFASAAESFLLPPFRPASVRSMSGAGDAFTAGLVWSALRGASLSDAACCAQAMACIAIASVSAVSEEMSPDAVLHTLKEELRRITQ